MIEPTPRALSKKWAPVFRSRKRNKQNISGKLHCDLSSGDRTFLYDLNDNQGGTCVISVRVTQKPLLAYNLEVADYHSYFVGKVGAWVLNGGDCDPNLPKGGTYKLKDPNQEMRVRRTGRTKDLEQRKGQHGRDPETKDLKFEVDRRTDEYAAQRAAST